MILTIYTLLLVVMVHSKPIPTTTYRTVSDLPSGSQTRHHNVLPDGHHRIVHNVDHVFPDGKYLKLHSNVTHSPHWVFVFLDAYNMTCDGEATLTVRLPPPDLVATLSASKPDALILHASHHFKCNNSIIFRRVEGFEMGADRVVIKTRTAKYWDVFQHANVRYDTDYYDQSHHHPTPASSISLHPQNVHHAMKPLWGWGIPDFITSTYNAVKTAVTDTVQTVVFVAKALVTGDVNIDDTRQIVNEKVSYNKDVTKTIEKWDIEAELKVAGSASATLSVHFKLTVNNYNLVLVRAEAMGAVAVAVRVEGTISYEFTKEWKTQIALIKLNTISFFAGPIPIVIMPSVPIVVGCKVHVEATANMVVTASGSGTINVGFEYDGTDYTPIQKQTLDFVAPDIQAASFTGTVTVTPWVEPTFVANIDLIGGPTSTMRVSGEAIMAYDTTDVDCLLNVIVNVHVLITVGATLEITVASVSVIPKKSFGPWTVFSNKYPVYSKCLIKPGGGGPAIPPPGPVVTNAPSAPYILMKASYKVTDTMVITYDVGNSQTDQEDGLLFTDANGNQGKNLYVCYQCSPPAKSTLNIPVGGSNPLTVGTWTVEYTSGLDSTGNTVLATTTFTVVAGAKAHHFQALDGPGFTAKDIGRVYTGSVVGTSGCGLGGGRRQENR